MEISRNKYSCAEMRGLTFVFNTDGSLYNYYLLMDKFFNLNQAECSFYSLLKDEKIKEVAFKEDGSIASFVKMPNGAIFARSKASFVSEQAVQVQNIYNESENIQKLVKYCLNNNIIPIFEYVSPKNRIVLKYTKTEIILIKLRNNLTGEYILPIELPTEVLEGNTIVNTLDGVLLDELILKCEKDSNYEGYVVTFESGKMIKLKLIEYVNLHNLHTEDLHREDSIISLILDEKIDDILAQLDEVDERRDMIMELIEIINHYLIRETNATESFLKNYKGNRKEFALAYRSSTYFPLVMIHLNTGEEIISIIKKKILKDTFRLMEARQWIKNQKELYVKM